MSVSGSSKTLAENREMCIETLSSFNVVGKIFNLVYEASPKTYAIYVENEWDGFITVTHTATGVAKCLQNKMFMMPLKNFCSETYCKRQRHLHERYPNIGKIPGIITAKQIKQIASFNWQNKWTKSKIYYY